jgi:hypothetical protein
MDKYRFDNGSLYEFDKESNAYIHCYRRAGCNTKKKAINEYEEELYSERCDE